MMSAENQVNAHRFTRKYYTSGAGGAAGVKAVGYEDGCATTPDANMHVWMRTCNKAIGGFGPRHLQPSHPRTSAL